MTEMIQARVKSIDRLLKDNLIRTSGFGHYTNSNRSEIINSMLQFFGNGRLYKFIESDSPWYEYEMAEEIPSGKYMYCKEWLDFDYLSVDDFKI